MVNYSNVFWHAIINCLSKTMAQCDLEIASDDEDSDLQWAGDDEELIDDDQWFFDEEDDNHRVRSSEWGNSLLRAIL